jgi:type II secretory pathway predicted ATPase ExeA
MVDAARDPFTPGAGVRPPFLAGRSEELAAFEVTVERASLGRAVRGTVVTGVRGMGKTVLIREFEKSARERDWAVVSVEADGRSHFQGQLADDATKAMHAVTGRPVIKERLRTLAERVRGIRLGADQTGMPTLGVDFDGNPPEPLGTRELSEILLSTARGLQEQQGTGLVVSVDELQTLDDVTLQALSLAAHRASQDLVPFLFLGAGLPELPGRLASVASYAERLYAYTELEPLTGDNFDDAIKKALDREGASINIEGLALLAATCHGYPFFAQAYGSATWRVAKSPKIKAADVNASAPLAEKELRGFFNARWSRATAEEQRYLRAISQSQDRGMSHAEARHHARLNEDASDRVRSRLHAKGLVFNPEPDVVRLTDPQFWRFIERQPK